MSKLVKPILKQVLVCLGERKQTSEGGIVLLAQSQKAENWGEVIAKGDKCELVEVGQEAYITSTQGTLYRFEGKDYILIQESKILMVRDQ